MLIRKDKMKGKIVDGEARDRLIIWIRRRMDEFGITIEALATSLQHDVDHPPLYRDARGKEWNGLDDMPDWIRAAKNAGVNPDFFRIESRLLAPTSEEVRSSGSMSDSRQLDLFF
jgi:DNA-binding protein H-NS